MIFIDCEFTSIEAPTLLSIGLVADDGRELYVELSAKSRLDGASSFVLDVVAPQLGRMPHAVANLTEFGERVGSWLFGITDTGKCAVDVAYDYHTDFDLLEHVLGTALLWERLQHVLRPTHVGYLIGHDDVKAAMERSWTASQFADGIERHHALADARALKCGFIAMHASASVVAGTR